MRIDKHVGSVHISINIDRLDKGTREAQRKLNEQIVRDSEPYVPFQQGALRNSVKYPDGIYGGQIEYDTPYAHYMYRGEVYGPNIPQKDAAGNIIGWRSPKGKAKYPTGRPLQYHHPGTGSQWFEKAKQKHLPDWVKLVKDTITNA